jgi:hypothetical protein
MPNPVTYPGARTFLSVGVEAIQGAAVAPTFTFPMESFLPQDLPTWIDDISLYGDMAALHGTQQGGVHTEFSLSGPWFGDYSPAFAHNILGDLSEDGVYSGAGTTTLTAQANPGATTISVAASLTSGAVVAIGFGTPVCEVRTLTSTGTTPTFVVPLLYTHPNASGVRPTVAPWSHVESLLNTAVAQPGSLTFIDWQGLTPTTQARGYAGACLSELKLKGVAESEFISMTAKGLGWPSAAAATLPVAAASTAQPLSSWRTLVGFAGPASGGTQSKQVSEFELTLTRQLKAEFTMQGSQNPFLIQRGNLGAAGTLTIPVPADETHLNYMLQNTQPALQFVVSNGLAGALLLSLQIDIAQGAYKTAPIQKAEAMGYQITFDMPANTTNAGASGGRSPIKITTQNAVHEAY